MKTAVGCRSEVDVELRIVEKRGDVLELLWVLKSLAQPQMSKLNLLAVSTRIFPTARRIILEKST